MEFDNIIKEQCVPGTDGTVSVGGTDPTTCEDVIPPVPPSTDDRCSDPAFYDANPDICAGYPKLILKPAYAITESGKTIQYKTFLRTAGDEQELTSGLDYRTANPGIASINETSGLATGVTAGVTTVSVAWQNLHAYAQIEVVAACSDVHGKFLLLIDNSKSSSVAFSSLYATKLSFAKEAALRFAETTNLEKDQVGVAYFNDVGAVILPPSSDLDLIKSTITGITTLSAKTNIASGLQAAIDELNILDGMRVIILFSDGENNSGDDPLPIAKAWKGANNVIISVAERSWGTYFDLMYRLASDGFFLSAYEGTENDVITTLEGLRSYLCSGDCAPTPGTFPHAKLDYKDFINWDVFRGHIDLIGLGLWDLQPGHGLYLDMNTGGIRTKDEFTFESGKTYRISLKVAGNNRWPTQVDKVKVTIGAHLVQTITVAAWNSPFTTYSFDFTPASTTNEKIQIEDATGKLDGALVDDVSLSNLTDVVTMLSDDFNSENPVTIDPGYGYTYGCLTTPPGAQLADPTPPTPPLPEP